MSSYLIKTVAARCRDLRLESNEPQIDLAARAGISLPTLKRFEKSGRISAEGLLSVLHALGRDTALLEALREPAAAANRPSLAQVLAAAQNAGKPRQRARRRAIAITLHTLTNATSSNSRPVVW